MPLRVNTHPFAMTGRLALRLAHFLMFHGAQNAAACALILLPIPRPRLS
jgi:hypothetical protein